MKKIALPVSNNNLCKSFDQCEEFIFYTIDNEQVIQKEIVAVDLQSGILPYWLSRQQVTDVIALHIDPGVISKLNEQKINVFVGVKLQNLDLLINEFLLGSIETCDIIKTE